MILKNNVLFDAIIISAATKFIPIKLLRSLKKSGKLIFPKRVEFNLLNSLPYNGGYFEFSNQNVYMIINKLQEDPNIRINSIPITERTAITSNQWIGSSGKQVRFSKEIPYIKL